MCAGTPTAEIHTHTQKPDTMRRRRHRGSKVTRIRDKLDRVMGTACEMEGVNPGEVEQVKRRTVENAIILEVGGDSRTIRKYKDYLRRFEYLQPLNQYVYNVRKVRFDENPKLEDFK